jgi:hypothetical protein
MLGDEGRPTRSPQQRRQDLAIDRPQRESAQVDLTRSPNRPGMAAICALLPLPAHRRMTKIRLRDTPGYKGQTFPTKRSAN